MSRSAARSDGAAGSRRAGCPADHSFPPFHARRPLSDGPERVRPDRSGGHPGSPPYEDFAGTVGRFLRGGGRRSRRRGAQAHALSPGRGLPGGGCAVRAARKGKDVAVFIELKARFDEARNVGGSAGWRMPGPRSSMGWWAEDPRQGGAGGPAQCPGTPPLRPHRHRRTTTSRPRGSIPIWATSRRSGDHRRSDRPLQSAHRFIPGAGLRVPASAGGPGDDARPDSWNGSSARSVMPRAGRGGLIRAQFNGVEDPEIVAALYRAGAAGVDVSAGGAGAVHAAARRGGVSERIRCRACWAGSWSTSGSTTSAMAGSGVSYRVG